MEIAVNKNKPKNRVPRCIGYCRVSTQDQGETGLSIDVQKSMILEKIAELGGVLVEEIYVDNGKSGTTMSRPGLTALLARCSECDFDYLILQAYSLLYRFFHYQRIFPQQTLHPVQLSFLGS